MSDTKTFQRKIDSVIPLSFSDTKEAIIYVRSHANDFHINSTSIGIVGFSAGGTLAVALAYTYSEATRPDFVAAIYPYVDPAFKKAVPADAPPMFIVAASDDQLGLAPHSVALYNDWLMSKHVAELHLYMKGGHGFGMRQQNLPVSTWVDRFGDWLKQMHYIKVNNESNLIKPSAEQIDENKQRQEEQFHSDWANMKRYRQQDSTIRYSSTEEDKVVFMGNSITEGWERADPEFFKRNHYINRGISGQTTPQMLLRFRQDVIDLHPKIVVILAGTNDIAGNTGPTTLEAIYGNIVSMTELAKVNHIKVIISSILPVYDYPWRPGLQPAGKIIRLNHMLKEYAIKNNAIYLDYFSSMADDRNGMKSKYSEDGVHPNASGYKIMEPLVERAISGALNKRN